MTERLHKQILIIILVLSLAIRLYKINEFPFFPFGDEIHPATSIISYLTTGRDVDGKIHAFLYDPMMSTPPIIGISMIPFLVILGKGILAIRLTSVCYGLLSVFVMYHLSLLITKNTKTALLASLLFSVTPWVFHYTRPGWEPSSQFFFLPLSIYLLLRGRQNAKYLLLGLIFSGISIYSYSTSIFLNPLFLFAILIIFRNDFIKFKKYLPLGFLLFTIIALPAFNDFLKEPQVNLRPKRILVTTDKTPSQAIKVFSEHYLGHFTLDFLFLNGDPNTRHGARNHGVLYIFMLPFILLGLFSFLKKKDVTFIFILFWLLAFPLGSALTDDGNPHATRSLIGSSVFVLLSSTGIVYFLSLLKKKPFQIMAVLVIFTVASFSLSNYLHDYFTKYPMDLYNSRSWDLNQGPVFDFVEKNIGIYKKICFNHYGWWPTDRFILYYFTPFNNPDIIYNIYKPPAYQKSDKATEIFNNENECGEKNSLLVLSVDKKIPSKNPLKTIYGLDGKEEYEIYGF